MPDKHAILSASAADRWLHCTAAPRTEERLPERTSSYAEEGRLAHAIAELKLRKLFTPMKASEYNKQMKALKADPCYQEEMQKCTDTYRDYIKEAAMSYKSEPHAAVEVRVDFSQFVPEGFGTSDCILIGGDTLHVIDYKHGQGVAVDAEDNPQMRLYALGALQTYLPIYGDAIKNIRMTIVQPRRDSISESAISRDALIDWGTFEVRPRAEAAYKGEGTFNPGEWCRFCRARNVCKARADDAISLEGVPRDDPAFLTAAQLGDYLSRAERLKSWASNVQDYALESVLQGRKIPGWKAVEGRSVRKISDVDKVFEILRQHGQSDALLYDRVPKTLTKLEELTGKKKLSKWCGSYIIKPPGKPALVPESDKRPALNSAEADFAGVAES